MLYKKAFIKLDEMGEDIIMFHIYLFHFGIMTYICVLPRSSRTEVFFKKVFLKIPQNSHKGR